MNPSRQRAQMTTVLDAPQVQGAVQVLAAFGTLRADAEHGGHLIDIRARGSSVTMKHPIGRRRVPDGSDRQLPVGEQSECPDEANGISPNRRGFRQTPVPQPQRGLERRIGVAGDQLGCAGCDRQSNNGRIPPLRHRRELDLETCPDAQPSFRVPGHRRLTIRGHRHGRDRTDMSRQNAQALGSRQRPEPQGLVFSPRECKLAVRGHRYGPNLALVPRHCVQTLTRISAPDTHGAVLAG